MNKYGNRLAFWGALIAFLISISGCYAPLEKAYYSDRSNFITEEASVENIIYIQERNKIVLWLTDTDPSYQAKEFVISGENAYEAINNDIFDKIQIGDVVTVTSAPRYFGDGYFMPIIGLSIDDSEILNIETGYQNLMNTY